MSLRTYTVYYPSEDKMHVFLRKAPNSQYLVLEQTLTVETTADWMLAKQYIQEREGK